MSLDYWILDGRDVRQGTRDEWGEMWENTDNRRVAETTVGDWWVSTVFLGIDHGWGGVPQLFETMVFWHGEGDPPAPFDDGEMQWRYATYDEAEVGHQAIVYKIANQLTEPS